MTAGPHAQAAYDVRVEWGPTGAAAVAAGPPRADVAVVVDVLSFTTTLDVAAGRGIRVHPYRWRDDGAAAYAAERDAVLAVGRLEARAGGTGVSLSPAALLARPSVHDVPRLVLPSPHGSAIAFGLADSGCEVVGACLRNGRAVGRWVARRLREGATVTLVAAGERWPDGSLRPAVEDLWGVGSVLTEVQDALSESPSHRARWSPEAEVALMAFHSAWARLGWAVRSCASGRELVEAGFADDVAVAAAHDVSSVVPVLVGDAFVPA